MLKKWCDKFARSLGWKVNTNSNIGISKELIMPREKVQDSSFAMPAGFRFGWLEMDNISEEETKDNDGEKPILDT
jgi:hypothetical protein